MEIINGILHILKNDGNPSLYSDTELDIDSETCEAFIAKHTKKLFNNPSAREATFREDSVLFNAMDALRRPGGSFRQAAQVAAERLHEIINMHKELPPGDLLIARVDVKDTRYFVLIKLNYKECFTHRAKEGDNQIIKNTTILPFSGGTAEAAALINLDSMEIKLLEKPHELGGESVYYFSEEYLECSAVRSRKETAQIIHEVTEEFVAEHFAADPKMLARMSCAITEEAEDADGVLSMDNVAARVFAEPDESGEKFRGDYVAALRGADIIEDMELGEKFVKREFGTKRIKSENGIEVKFPAELAVDDEQVEIQQHEDGTVTVVLKRLRL